MTAQESRVNDVGHEMAEESQEPLRSPNDTAEHDDCHVIAKPAAAEGKSIRIIMGLAANYCMSVINN
jgi:hypothetical protein